MDAVLLEQVLWHIHNWFPRESVTAGCTIADGALPASVAERLLDGQWYRIEGSYLNDGLHQHPAEDLSDETFDGTITMLAIPKALLSVVDEIAAWQEANGDALNSPYTSESFGGYSYSIKGGLTAETSSQGLSGWRLAFKDNLNPWRKMA